MIGPRSARTNIIWSLAAKLVSMLLAILSVPLLLNILGIRQYGIWVALTSLISFISLLDFGVGNSMRNSVASMDEFNADVVRSEFIGFFRLLCCVGLVAAGSLTFIIPLWDAAQGYSFAAQLLYFPLLFLLPLMLGASVLQGSRATGLQAVLQSSGSWSFFVLIGIIAWTKCTPTIDGLAFAWVFFYSIPLIITFGLSLKRLRLPLSRLFGRSFGVLPKERLRVGLDFFVLQLSSLFLYNLGNILILNQLGGGEVARYDVINKIYQVGLSLYTVVIGVTWPEIAIARSKENDKVLIKIFEKLILFACIFAAISLLSGFLAPSLVSLWTAQRIEIDSHEAFAIAGLVALQSFAYIGAVFMNAFERIRPQIVMGLLSIILMVPLSTYFISSGLGIVSVPLAAIILTLLPMVVCNIYALKLIRNVSQKSVFS